jgi:KipI family sensor histidine kinase inhibitor
VTPPSLEALGDSAWLLRLGDAIDPATVRRVHALAARLRATAPTGVCDVVPAYASVAVFVSPDAVAADIGLPPRIEHWLAEASADVDETDARAARIVEIPVRYGGDEGCDLGAVARHCGLREDEVIARHAAAEYSVAMLGFAPGFPYLLGLDPALATPRHTQPRTRVAAGSVGIGGAQTGVYPRESPGGWQIIGRTPLTLFDAMRAEPSLLQPGDRLRFVPLR